ncbi:galactosylceramide sulfotransferase-like [Penaeus indicus]|uniref:galactosylceramide sulfotransferase-like n=1 Tax=Penaeus indicus TaxID=29960 RepID=UPI00300CFBA3
MARFRDYKLARNRDNGGPTMLVRMLVVLCVVSSMALVLQLNLANQQSFMLRNIKGFEEPRGWTPSPAPSTCRPRRHLVFLKTHKCGSSTIQNILFRYAFHNNLSVALPYSGVYLDNTLEGQSLKVKELRDSPFAPPSGKYHFLIHHTRLNVRAIQQLTYDDSLWITIVREPSAVFESMFHYYRLHKFYGATFDHLLWKLEGGFSSRFKLNNRYMGRLGRNQMTWDMGLDDQDLRQEAVLKEALKLLDHTFHLVMLAERMDESLVLLKHLLCWSDEDVLVMSRNVRKDRYRSYLSEQSVATLEHFNSMDVKFYSFFRDRFDKQVEAFGRSRMEEEVVSLREYRDKMWRDCGMKEAQPKKQGSGSEKEQQYVVQYQVQSNGSMRHRRFCKDLVRTGVEFTQILRWKQYSRYHRAVNNPWNISWSPKFNKKPRRSPKKIPLISKKNIQKERHSQHHAR